MSVLEYVIGALLIISSLVLILMVMFQEPKGRGLSGAIGGDMGANASGPRRGADILMAKYTKVFGIVFVVLAIALSVVSLLAK